jgi:hypothetical protein
MHSEENGTTHRQQQSDGDSPAKRMVRSLLGLPEMTAGGLHGHVPAPPGTFRYQIRPSAGEPSLHWPLSGWTPDQSADMESAIDRLDREEEDPQTKAIAPGEPPKVDRPAADDDQRVVSPPAAKSGKRPLARPAPAHMMPGMASVMPAVSGAEKPRQTAADSGQAVAGEKVTTPGGRQEIAIPGRSTDRQFFASLAQAESDNLSSAGPAPHMPQPPMPLHSGQAQHDSATMDHDDRSDNLRHGTEPALPPADRRLTPRAAMPLPSATQADGLAPQATATAPMAAAQKTRPATVLRTNLPRVTADNTAEHGSEGHITAAAPEIKPTLVVPQRQEHPSAQAKPRSGERNPSVTPARRPDEDGARQIEELRRTFYELIIKKATAAIAQVNEQTTTDGQETPQQQPVQQIVVINSTSGSRSRGRMPAAFWERSYMARTTLKMIR